MSVQDLPFFPIAGGGNGNTGGKDGVSPTITTATIDGGHRLTIVDAVGTKTIDIMNGLDGSSGKDGYSGTDGITPHVGANANWFIGNTDTGMPSRGETGAQGPRGEKGEPGNSGVYFGETAPTDENVNVWIKETDNSGNTLNFISYTPQDLTPEQQAQARQNLGLDELPTGGGSNYRLIAKIVFDETNQTKYIKITQDMDGKPLELTKVLIYADWLATTSRADCKLKLNNIDFQWFFNLEQTAYKTILEAEMFEDLCYINYHSKIPGTSKAEGGGVYAVNIPELKINEIVWRTLGVNPPPNGSTFAVYGY